MALLSPQPPDDLRPAAALNMRQLLPDVRFRASATPAARAWLLHDGSLTERIRRRHGSIAVRLDREGIGMPSALEAQLLDRTRRGGWWIREITMSAVGTALLRARTLVPPDALRLRTLLMGLGSTPLGQLLFRADRLRPEVVRGGRGFAQAAVGAGAGYGPEARSTVQIADPGREAALHPWLRLARYRVGDESLLVIERPLPALLAPALADMPASAGESAAGAGGRVTG